MNEMETMLEPVDDPTGVQVQGETENRGFTIDDDEKAEWALRKILEAQRERDRLTALADRSIETAQQRKQQVAQEFENNTNWLRWQLHMYMDTVECRKLKSSRKYRLLSGTLVEKNPTIEYKRDDATIIRWLEARGLYGMITVKKTPNWAELKKLCDVTGDAVVLAGTGEIIDGVTVEEHEGQFVIEEDKRDGV